MEERLVKNVKLVECDHCWIDLKWEDNGPTAEEQMAEDIAAIRSNLARSPKKCTCPLRASCSPSDMCKPAGRSQECTCRSAETS